MVSEGYLGQVERGYLPTAAKETEETTQLLLSFEYTSRRHLMFIQATLKPFTLSVLTFC